MRQKELRIALVCYGGVSLAVYMHGVTKELWKLARASRAFHGGEDFTSGTEAVYLRALRYIAQDQDLHLRVMPDILAGASAGGINAVFLAQAIHAGHSLEPLTDLWLEKADVDALLDPQAAPLSRATKFWAQPIVQWVLSRPGNAISESVAPETRDEVRAKLSRFIRGRWFEPPFSGIGFSRMLREALEAMAEQPIDGPLLPPGHPIDLFVTATDFHGHLEYINLNSPAVVEESEHRLPIGFTGKVPHAGGAALSHPLDLVFAARSTASFPGAFPPLQVAEIDRLAGESNISWPTREGFLSRIMPGRARRGKLESASLIDGSVLVNAPFSEAMGALRGRPSLREVDRRFVYIDPTPDDLTKDDARRDRPVGFFANILGSVSSIPREQPIRDNLELIDAQSREAERLSSIVSSMRPQIEAQIEKMFGRTLFLDKPTPRRLKGWRSSAQQAAAEQAGYAYHAYAEAKFHGIVDRLADTVQRLTPDVGPAQRHAIAASLQQAARSGGLQSLSARGGGASSEAIAFFRAHDIGFRIRRLRLLARRLAREWVDEPGVTESDRDAAQAAIFSGLSRYFEHEAPATLGADFADIAREAGDQPGRVLEEFAQRRALPELDLVVEAELAEALQAMPKNLRRRMLLAYLGFPFYDLATLPLLRNDRLTEFDPIKVDRISPEDATAIRDGGTAATLRGTEFYNFGAFFSRAYRENDYLWGRLHGAERMADLLSSTLDGGLPIEVLSQLKRDLFLAVLEEERERLTADPRLIPTIREEVLATMPLG